MKILDVNLVVFEDDATGEYGLCPQGTEDKNFNAFWNGIGIFHDVFEHWFEEKHKYFMGDYSYNICGEMCAMGAAFYYYNMLGDARSGNSYGDFYNSLMNTTRDEIMEAVRYGYINFGYELKTCIPRQKAIDGLEDYLEKYLKEALGFTVNTEEDYESAIVFKKSIKFNTIVTPHRYGYKMAERLIPSSWRNVNTLNDFIIFFNEFCNNNSAQEFSWEYSGINVKVFKEKGDIRIKAYKISHEENKRIQIFNSEDY